MSGGDIMKFRLKRCPVCDSIPFYSRYLEWTRDGAILGRDKARTRVVFLEVEEIHNQLNGISEKIGLSIDRIVYNAEKEVGKRFISTLVPEIITRLPRTRLTRPAVAQRLLGRYIISPYIAQLGMGLTTMLDYRPGKMHVFSLMNPYSVPVLAGDGAGIFEYLERIGVEATWEVDSSGNPTVTLRKSSERPGVEERLAYERASYLPGNAELNICPVCQVPREVSETFDFDPAQGIVKNRFSGCREVVMPTQSFSAIFRELERELGDEIPAIIVDLERRYVRDNLSERGTILGRPDVLSLLMDFTWRGIGNPVSAIRGKGGTDITIENPFNPSLVAGKVAGLYEAWTGKPVRFNWTEEMPGRLKVSLML